MPTGALPGEERAEAAGRCDAGAPGRPDPSGSGSVLGRSGPEIRRVPAPVRSLCPGPPGHLLARPADTLGVPPTPVPRNPRRSPEPGPHRAAGVEATEAARVRHRFMARPRREPVPGQSAALSR